MQWCDNTSYLYVFHGIVLLISSFPSLSRLISTLPQHRLCSSGKRGAGANSTRTYVWQRIAPCANDEASYVALTAEAMQRCEASARHRDARGEAYSTWRGPRDEREKEAARRREGEREREHEQDVRVRMRVSWGMMIQVLTAALLFVCRYHCCST